MTEVDAAGDVINYTIVVKHGRVNLTSVTVNATTLIANLADRSGPSARMVS
ncbi:MAG: hypothetical protein R2856_14745 [Caldilineaceae bacterium]